jgi:hypothetical protein
VEAARVAEAAVPGEDAVVAPDPDDGRPTKGAVAQAKEGYRRKEIRLSGVDPCLFSYNMTLLQFERELNQCHDIQKSKDDMAIALEDR